MKMFNLLGYGEKAGSGFPGIIDACSASVIPPTIEEATEFHRTIVTIWLKGTQEAIEARDSGDTK